MKIARLDLRAADAGWRNACFLKITTDEGVVGWSEYCEHVGTTGLSHVISSLGELVCGMDALAIEQVAAFLKARTRQAGGGINQHAIAAIVNALLDIKGKALGVPVHELLGGALRERIPVYWSHCGTYRMRHAALLGTPSITTYDDMVRLGHEVRERGFCGAKTSIMLQQDDGFTGFNPGFAGSSGYPALNPDKKVLADMMHQLEAFREGLGPDLNLMLDVNFNFRTDGFVQLAHATASFDLSWLELDTPDPTALAHVRAMAPCPIASCETLYGRAELRPFLERQAVDVVIIDVLWNGYIEALKMASLAEAYEVNVATHNYGGGVLGDVMSAHFACAIPNLRLCEYDADDVPWKHEFLTSPIELEHGEIVVPKGAGWGVDVNEEALQAHPPR